MAGLAPAGVRVPVAGDRFKSRGGRRVIPGQVLPVGDGVARGLGLSPAVPVTGSPQFLKQRQGGFVLAALHGRGSHAVTRLKDHGPAVPIPAEGGETLLGVSVISALQDRQGRLVGAFQSEVGGVAEAVHADVNGGGFVETALLKQLSAQGPIR